MKANSFYVSRGTSLWFTVLGGLTFGAIAVVTLASAGVNWDITSPLSPRAWLGGMIFNFLLGFSSFLLTVGIFDRYHERANRKLLCRKAFNRQLGGSFKSQMVVVMKDFRKKHTIHENQVDLLLDEIDNLIALAIAGNMSPQRVERDIASLAHDEEARLFGTLLAIPPVSVRVLPGESTLYVNGKLKFRRDE